MGCHRNRLDKPIKFLCFFSFSTSPVPPGPLWSCPGSLPKGSFLEWDQNLGFGASLESPQRAGQNVLIFFDVTHVTPGPLWRVISWVGPRPGLSSKRARQIFFKYLTSLIPPGPLRRVPAVSQKGHFQNRTKTRVVGYQQDWLNAPVNFLNLFLNFWPHMSHQDPSWGSRQPPKRVISRIQ